jgi:hypothetical protein
MLSKVKMKKDEEPSILFEQLSAITLHRNGMYDVKKAKCNDAITMGNGKSEDATVIGNIDGKLCHKNGNTFLNDAKTSDVTNLPKGKYNLFSITKLQNDGWILGGNADAIWLTKGDIEIKFDIKIPTPKGVLYAMYHERKAEVVAAPMTTTATTANADIIHTPPKRTTVKKAHDMLGHINEKSVLKTALSLGWDLTRGTLGVCEPCTEAKARQKNLPRHPEAPPSMKDDSRIYLDIATIRKTKKGPKVYQGNWRIMVDEREHNSSFLTSPTARTEWSKKPASNIIVGKKVGERLKLSDWIMQVKINCFSNDRRVQIGNLILILNSRQGIHHNKITWRNLDSHIWPTTEEH